MSGAGVWVKNQQRLQHVLTRWFPIQFVTVKMKVDGSSM